MAKVAAAIRARLRDETDLDVLQSYETLWELEFQSHPPTEHEAVRKWVSGDLQRLETAVPAPDAEFQSFLIRGYKLSAALGRNGASQGRSPAQGISQVE